MSQKLLDNVATGGALFAVFMVIGLLSNALGEDGTRAMGRVYALALAACLAVSGVAMLLGGRIHRQ